MDPSYNSNVSGPANPTPQPTISSGGDIFLPPSQPVMTVKKSKKPLIITIIALIILALTGVGIWLFMNNQAVAPLSETKNSVNDAMDSFELKLKNSSIDASGDYLQDLKGKLLNLKRSIEKSSLSAGDKDSLMPLLDDLVQDTQLYVASTMLLYGDTLSSYIDHGGLNNIISSTGIPAETENAFIINAQFALQQYADIKEEIYRAEIDQGCISADGVRNQTCLDRLLSTNKKYSQLYSDAASSANLLTANSNIMLEDIMDNIGEINEKLEAYDA